jgi:hypothetical protein
VLGGILHGRAPEEYFGGGAVCVRQVGQSRGVGVRLDGLLDNIALLRYGLLWYWLIRYILLHIIRDYHGHKLLSFLDDTVMMEDKFINFNIVFPFKEHERGPEIDGRPMPAVPLFRNAQILADGCALLLQIQISNKIGIVLPPCVIFVMTLCWRFFISCAICRREWKPERKP